MRLWVAYHLCSTMSWEIHCLLHNNIQSFSIWSFFLFSQVGQICISHQILQQFLFILQLIDLKSFEIDRKFKIVL